MSLEGPFPKPRGTGPCQHSETFPPPSSRCDQTARGLCPKQSRGPSDKIFLHRIAWVTSCPTCDESALTSPPALFHSTKSTFSVALLMASASGHQSPLRPGSRSAACNGSLLSTARAPRQGWAAWDADCTRGHTGASLGGGQALGRALVGGMAGRGRAGTSCFRQRVRFQEPHRGN